VDNSERPFLDETNMSDDLFVRARVVQRRKVKAFSLVP